MTEEKTIKAKEVDKEVKVAEVEVDTEKGSKKKGDYLYAVGKRKTAIAQVRVYKKGEGTFEVNGMDIAKYFPTYELQEVVMSSLRLIGQDGKLNVTIKVSGGGKEGQAEAARHGISLALIQLNPNFRKPLKKAGFIKRDARKKERKKPGLKSARRAPQFSKR